MKTKIYIVIRETFSEDEGPSNAIVGVYDNKMEAAKYVSKLFLEEMEDYAGYYGNNEAFRGKDYGDGVAIIKAVKGWNETHIVAVSWTVNTTGWYDLGISGEGE